MKNILCFIPARKGSKGIKNKNLIRINKKPLIYYTLRQAYKLKKTHKVEIKISTDSIITFVIYWLEPEMSDVGLILNYLKIFLI